MQDPGDFPDARNFTNFADLARAQVRGRDYEIRVTRRPSSPVAIIAPHGGEIEDGTSEVARAIAGAEFNLYCFEGTRPSRNYAALHLTSHRFDEPECLSLIRGCSIVVAVHGCAGAEPMVFLGGLDVPLRDRLARALYDAGVRAETAGHRFPAVRPDNVCNRGAGGRGVQLEITHPLRRPGEVVRLGVLLGAVLAGITGPA
jgi:phage replication-related protein YjqB (UPF0714/DUF867 family)